MVVESHAMGIDPGRAGPIRFQSRRLASTWSTCSRSAGMST